MLRGMEIASSSTLNCTIDVDKHTRTCSAAFADLRLTPWSFRIVFSHFVTLISKTFYQKMW